MALESRSKLLYMAERALHDPAPASSRFISQLFSSPITCPSGNYLQSCRFTALSSASHLSHCTPVSLYLECSCHSPSAFLNSCLSARLGSPLLTLRVALTCPYWNCQTSSLSPPPDSELPAVRDRVWLGVLLVLFTMSHYHSAWHIGTQQILKERRKWLSKKSFPVGQASKVSVNLPGQ